MGQDDIYPIRMTEVGCHDAWKLKHKINDNKFEANHLFKHSYTLLMLSWKSVVFVFVIITLVSLTKKTGIEVSFRLQVSY
jgi:hypothetical protein